MKFHVAAPVFRFIATVGQISGRQHPGKVAVKCIQYLAATLFPIRALEKYKKIIATDMPDKIHVRVAMNR